MLQIIYALAALASGCAAVLAWVAKIRWANEFKDAKEAQISAKDSQIQAIQESRKAELEAKDAQLETLREITSTKLLSELKASKEMYERIMEERRSQIARLEQMQVSKDELIDELKASKEALQREMDDAEQNLKKQVEEMTRWTIRLRGTGTVGAAASADPTDVVQPERNEQ